jgi:hypothetical protein
MLAVFVKEKGTLLKPVLLPLGLFYSRMSHIHYVYSSSDESALRPGQLGPASKESTTTTDGMEKECTGMPTAGVIEASITMICPLEKEGEQTATEVLLPASMTGSQVNSSMVDEKWIACNSIEI